MQFLSEFVMISLLTLTRCTNVAAFSTDAWVVFHGEARLFPTNVRQPPAETTLGLLRSRLPIFRAH